MAETTTLTTQPDAVKADQAHPATDAPAAAPQRNWEAELAKANKEAAKSAKQVKDLEAQLAANNDVLGKLKGMFSPETQDPAAEVNALRETATRSQQAMVRAAREAAAVRFAAREDAHDAEDVASFLAGREEIEVDPLTGRVKDPDAVAQAVRDLKAKKPHWFRQAAPAVAVPTPAPIVGRVAPVPGVAQVDSSPKPMAARDLWKIPLSGVRSAIARGTH